MYTLKIMFANQMQFVAMTHAHLKANFIAKLGEKDIPVC